MKLLRIVFVFMAACSIMVLSVEMDLAGHSTGHEIRTVAQCERLPLPDRQFCIKCVTRPAAHHFHMDYPPGTRCRINNGMP